MHAAAQSSLSLTEFVEIDGPSPVYRHVGS